MRSILIILGTAMLLTGCATHVVSSNERSVVVESEAMDAGMATDMANEECKKYNRIAKMTIKADYRDRNYVFDCVTP